MTSWIITVHICILKMFINVNGVTTNFKNPYLNTLFNTTITGLPPNFLIQSVIIIKTFKLNETKNTTTKSEQNWTLKFEDSILLHTYYI